MCFKSEEISQQNLPYSRNVGKKSPVIGTDGIKAEPPSIIAF